MSNLQQLLTEIQPENEQNPRIRSLLINEEGLAELDCFLDKSGFRELRFLGAGSGAIVFYVNENPDIVIRIAPNNSKMSERIINPHVLQPIFVKDTFDNLSSTKVEILPRLKDTDSLTDEAFLALRDNLIESTAASDTWGMSDFNANDYGIFEYSDPRDRSAVNHSLMAVDDSALYQDSSTQIACTSNYPSLQFQQAKQQALWDNDERLQRLLPNGPAILPETRIIPNIKRQDIERH